MFGAFRKRWKTSSKRPTSGSTGRIRDQGPDDGGEVSRSFEYSPGHDLHGDRLPTYSPTPSVSLSEPCSHVSNNIQPAVSLLEAVKVKSQQLVPPTRDSMVPFHKEELGSEKSRQNLMADLEKVLLQRRVAELEKQVEEQEEKISSQQILLEKENVDTETEEEEMAGSSVVEGDRIVAEYQAKFAELENQLSRYKDLVTDIVGYKTQVEHLQKERNNLASTYEEKVKDYETLLVKMRDQNDKLVTEIKKLESTAVHYGEREMNMQQLLLERVCYLQAENSALGHEIELQKRQYERWLDDVATQVVQALLAQKSLREECNKLKQRVGDLELQNHKLHQLIQEKLCYSQPRKVMKSRLPRPIPPPQQPQQILECSRNNSRLEEDKLDSKKNETGDKCKCEGVDGERTAFLLHRYEGGDELYQAWKGLNDLSRQSPDRWKHRLQILHCLNAADATSGISAAAANSRLSGGEGGLDSMETPEDDDRLLDATLTLPVSSEKLVTHYRPRGGGAGGVHPFCNSNNPVYGAVNQLLYEEREGIPRDRSCSVCSPPETSKDDGYSTMSSDLQLDLVGTTAWDQSGAPGATNTVRRASAETSNSSCDETSPSIRTLPSSSTSSSNNEAEIVGSRPCRASLNPFLTCTENCPCRSNKKDLERTENSSEVDWWALGGATGGYDDGSALCSADFGLRVLDEQTEEDDDVLFFPIGLGGTLESPAGFETRGSHHHLLFKSRSDSELWIDVQFDSLENARNGSASALALSGCGGSETGGGGGLYRSEGRLSLTTSTEEERMAEVLTSSSEGVGEWNLLLLSETGAQSTEEDRIPILEGDDPPHEEQPVVPTVILDFPAVVKRRGGGPTVGGSWRDAARNTWPFFDTKLSDLAPIHDSPEVIGPETEFNRDFYRLCALESSNSLNVSRCSVLYASVPKYTMTKPALPTNNTAPSCPVEEVPPPPQIKVEVTASEEKLEEETPIVSEISIEQSAIVPEVEKKLESEKVDEPVKDEVPLATPSEELEEIGVPLCENNLPDIIPFDDKLIAPCDDSDNEQQISPQGDATLQPQEGATLKSQEGATLQLLEGATLQLQEEITLQLQEESQGVTLQLLEGATLKLQEGVTLQLQEGATQQSQEGATLQPLEDVPVAVQKEEQVTTLEPESLDNDVVISPDINCNTVAVPSPQGARRATQQNEKRNAEETEEVPKTEELPQRETVEDGGKVEEEQVVIEENVTTRRPSELSTTGLHELHELIGGGYDSADESPMQPRGGDFEPGHCKEGSQTSWIHLEADVDLTDPKTRANLLDQWMSSSSGSDSGDESRLYQHLHDLHRRRRHKKASDSREDCVLRYVIPARPSILDRTDMFVRYGEKEREAVASFDFLEDMSTSISDSDTINPDELTDDEREKDDVGTRAVMVQDLNRDSGCKEEAQAWDRLSLSDSCAESFSSSTASIDAVI